MQEKNGNPEAMSGKKKGESQRTTPHAGGGGKVKSKH